MAVSRAAKTGCEAQRAWDDNPRMLDPAAHAAADRMRNSRRERLVREGDLAGIEELICRLVWVGGIENRSGQSTRGVVDYDLNPTPAKPQAALEIAKSSINPARIFIVGSLAHLRLKTFSRFTTKEVLGLGVAQDGLGLWIPNDFAIQSCSDSSKMACGHSSMVAMHIRDRFCPIASRFEEVSEVVDQWPILVGLFKCSLWQRIVFQVVDCFACDSSTVDEQASLGAFEHDAVIPIVADFDLGVLLKIGVLKVCRLEFDSDEKLCSGVVSRRIGRISIAKFDWVLDHLWDDFTGTGIC